jgi:DNA-binding transcriptional LysR family regulator
MTIERMRDIHAFVHVAEAKSFTAAAERIGLSRSAVGKSVLRLEDRLGVRLLQRTTRSVSLTGEGAVFLERCIRILADLDEAEMSMLSHSQTPRGRLRLELPVSFGRLHVLPIVNQFMSKWPEISVNISFNDRFVDLIDEGTDLAIRLGGSDDSRLMTRLLAPHRLVTCASPTYLKSHGVPANIEELAGHSCLSLFTADAQSIGVSASTATFAPWPSTVVSVQRTQRPCATPLSLDTGSRDSLPS